MKDNFIPVVMLLSSDWFSLAKNEIGLEPIEDFDTLQADLRRVIPQVNEGNNYWHIDRTPSRIDGLFENISKVLRGHLSVSGYNMLMRPCLQPEDVGAMASLAATITHDLIADDRQELFTDEERRFVEEALERLHLQVSRLQSVASNSSTPWDMYLKNLTPDLPDFLSDFAVSEYLKPLQFQMFWKRILERLDVTKRAKVMEEYEEAAKLYKVDAVALKSYLISS